MTTMQIHLEHLTRVEGHGDIVVDVQAGKILESKLHVVEAPRFFEAFLRGHYWYQAPELTSRICGICSIGHTLTSIRAVENAMGVEPTRQTKQLRKLLFHAETNTSHVLHCYFLVAPDFFGAGSVIPLVGSHPEVVLRALRMKRLWNHLAEVMVGRKIHSIALVPGGFTHIPKASEFRALRQELVDGLPDLKATVDLFKTLTFPAFERDTEYLSLSKPHEYAYIDGVIRSTGGSSRDGDYAFDIQDYRDHVSEYMVKHSSSKHVKAKRDSYMVGALARFNNSYPLLNDEAKAVAREFGLKQGSTNTFMNSVAQLVEIVHCHHDAIRLIDELLDAGLREERPDVTVKAGRGVGACDVPRGLLIHDYEIDDEGKLVHANCIIPTNMNLANIDRDMEKLVPEWLGKGKTKEELTLGLEMLVRAYDPCISCSCHFLDVKYVNG